MVKFRGVEICVMSQFDCQRLPEYAQLDETKTDTHAICYIPIHSGSQIWLEYSIDGPHPPQAAYFFKLVLNGQHVVSWDCTDRHNYHGKMAYALREVNIEHGSPRLQRSALQFVNDVKQRTRSLRNVDDCMEIRIYRIEHRQRLRPSNVLPEHSISNRAQGRLRLVNGEIMHPSFPRRQYKYQLLDPLDQPYAAFRFYYCDPVWLQGTGSLDHRLHSLYSSPLSSRASSVIWYDPDSTVALQNISRNQSTDTVQVYSPQTTDQDISDRPTSSPASPTTSLHGSTQNLMNESSYQLGNSSEDSLRLITRDSIEDLSSQVPRSPRSPRNKTQSSSTSVEDRSSPVNL